MSTPTESAAQESELVSQTAMHALAVVEHCLVVPEQKRDDAEFLRASVINAAAWLKDVRTEMDRLASAPQPPITKDAPCPLCKGAGKNLVSSFVDPSKQIEQSCRVCKGSGVLESKDAPAPAQDGVGRNTIDLVCLKAAEIHALGQYVSDDRAQTLIDEIRYLLASPPLQPTPIAQPALGEWYVERMDAGKEDYYRVMYDHWRATEAEALAFIESCRTAQPNGDKS